MALRAFQWGGVPWQVWSVIPGARHDAERRRGADRRSPEPIFRYRGPERRRAMERRRTAAAVSTAFAAGWVVFQAPTERRRLAPIPADWETLSASDLARLCERARPVPGAPEV